MGFCALFFLGLALLSGCGEFRLPGIAVPDVSARLTFAFDDGNRSDIALAAPILRRYDFTGVSFVTTGWIGSPNRLTWDQVRALKATFGWEIASQAASHLDLTRLTEAGLAAELDTSLVDLRAQGLEPIGFAAPFGAIDDNVVVACARRGLYLRSQGDAGANPWPYSRYRIRARSVHVGVALKEVQSWITDALREKSWLVLVFHGIVDTALSPPQGEETAAGSLALIAEFADWIGIEVETAAGAFGDRTSNLIQNGSFEQGLLHWQTDTPLRLAIDMSGVGAYPNPTAAARIQGGVTSASLENAPVAIAPDRRYAVELYADTRSLGSSELDVAVDLQDASGAPVATQSLGTLRAGQVGAEGFGFETPPAAAAAVVRLFLGAGAQGSALLDEVSLLPVTRHF